MTNDVLKVVHYTDNGGRREFDIVRDTMTSDYYVRCEMPDGTFRYTRNSGTTLAGRHRVLRNVAKAPYRRTWFTSVIDRLYVPESDFGKGDN